eukprot:8770972-Pyramimonas_sp.AAC.1
MRILQVGGSENIADVVQFIGGPKLEAVVDKSGPLFLHCGRNRGLSDVYRALLSEHPRSRLVALPLPAPSAGHNPARAPLRYDTARLRLAEAGACAVG